MLGAGCQALFSYPWSSMWQRSLLLGKGSSFAHAHESFFMNAKNRTSESVQFLFLHHLFPHSV